MRVGFLVVFILAVMFATAPLVADDAPASDEEQQAVARNAEAALLREFRRRDASTGIATASRRIDSRQSLTEAVDRPMSSRRDSGSEPVRIELDDVQARFGNLSSLRLVDEAAGAAAIDERQNSVDLQPGEFLTVRPHNSEPVVTMDETGRAAASGTRLITVDTRGRTRELSLFHHTDRLTWRPERSRFVGNLLVGVTELTGPGDPASDAQISIPVQLSAAGATLSPDDLRVRRIGPPYERVSVEVDFPADPYSVRLITAIDPDFPEAIFPVKRPELRLVVNPTLRGLGLGAADVIIQPHETVLRAGESIALQVDRGWLRDNPVTVDEAGQASTVLRSDWIGEVELKLASTDIYRAAPVTIQYTFPVRFLISSVIGAMLGALVYVYRLRRSGDRSRKRLGFDWLIGALLGLIAPLMAYVGMKLPQWMPLPEAFTGEVVPFLLAFVTAALGTALIDWIGGGITSVAGGSNGRAT